MNYFVKSETLLLLFARIPTHGGPDSAVLRESKYGEICRLLKMKKINK